MSINFTNLYLFHSTENKKILPKLDEPTEQSKVNDIDNNDITDPLIKVDSTSIDCDGDISTNQISGCAVRQRAVIYTAETLHLLVIGACFAGLFIGFLAGYLVSRRLNTPPHYADAPFIEQRNHLER